MERALLANIVKIYALGFFNALQLVIPVFVPLLMGKGLSMAEILQTQAVFAITVAICEVPSGYLADLLGRKFSLLASALFMLLSYACLYNASTFTDFLVFEIVAGIAISLSSGADMALLFDSQLALQKLSARFRLPASVGNLVSFTSAAEALAAVAASAVFLLLDTGLAFEVLLGLQLLVGLPPVLLALSLVEPPRLISEFGHSENARKIATTLIFGDRLVFWVAVNTVAFGLIALLAFWTFQPFWEWRNIPLEMFGFLWALHCTLRAFSARFAVWLEGFFGARQLLVIIAALPCVALLGMVGLPGYAAIVCALLFPLCRGVNSVILFDALNRRVEATFRATINSVLNLAIRGLFIGFGPVLGWLVDTHGLPFSLLLLAVLAVPVLSLVTLALLLELQRQENMQQDTAPEPIPGEQECRQR